MTFRAKKGIDIGVPLKPDSDMYFVVNEKGLVTNDTYKTRKEAEYFAKLFSQKPHLAKYY